MRLISFMVKFLSAHQVDSWNISISDINSSSIKVAWTHYVPDPSYLLYLYAVICTPIGYEAGPIVVTANNTNQTDLQVRQLRALTEYNVQVLAVTMHNGSGALSFRGSLKRTIRTPEGGK